MHRVFEGCLNLEQQAFHPSAIRNMDSRRVDQKMFFTFQSFRTGINVLYRKINVLRGQRNSIVKSSQTYNAQYSMAGRLLCSMALAALIIYELYFNTRKIACIESSDNQFLDTIVSHKFRRPPVCSETYPHSKISELFSLRSHHNSSLPSVPLFYCTIQYWPNILKYNAFIGTSTVH